MLKRVKATIAKTAVRIHLFFNWLLLAVVHINQHYVFPLLWRQLLSDAWKEICGFDLSRFTALSVGERQLHRYIKFAGGLMSVTPAVWAGVRACRETNIRWKLYGMQGTCCCCGGGCWSFCRIRLCRCFSGHAISSLDSPVYSSIFCCGPDGRNQTQILVSGGERKETGVKLA